MRSRRETVAWIAGVLGALALASAMRLSVWSHVFTPQGVRFSVDTDTLYHVLRADRLLRGEAGAAWSDPFIDYPRGARALWPPGFDALLAVTTRVVGGSGAARGELEHVAAWMPVVLSLLGLATIGALGAAWFGRATGLLAMFLGGVLPITTVWGLLGRPDHHVLEVLVFTVLLLVFERSVRPGARPWWIAALGLVLACAPWIWQGAALYPGFLAVAVLLIRVLRPAGAQAASRAARVLALGSALGAAAFAVSLALWTPPDALRPRSLAGVSAFYGALLLAVAAYSACLLLLERSAAASRRALEAGLIGAAALVPVAFAFPGPIAHALRTITARDPFWATVAEVQPLIFGRKNALAADVTQMLAFVGPVILAPVLAIPAYLRAWREGEDRRTGLLLAALGAGVFLVLTVHSIRFQLYLGPFAVVAGALVVRELATRSPGGSRALGRTLAALAACLLLYPAVPLAFADLRALDEEDIALLAWLRDQPSPEPAVLAPWEWGHAIQYYSGRPVVASPFGTDVGDDGLKALAAFFYAPSPGAAREVLARTRAGWVLLGDPLVPVADAWAFAPPATRPLARSTHTFESGRHIEPEPGFEQAMGSWLQDFDGVAEQFEGQDVPSLGSFRLVFETRDRGALPLKLFQVVGGAQVAVLGAEPGARVRAAASVRTNQGRKFLWWTSGRADASGKVALRVPYATGLNGTTRVGEVTVTAGTRQSTVALTEASVLSGAVVETILR